MCSSELDMSVGFGLSCLGSNEWTHLRGPLWPTAIAARDPTPGLLGLNVSARRTAELFGVS
eukprot:8333992-Pyramimonas_sp.AAC.1